MRFAANKELSVTSIIAGRFQQQWDADDTIDDLLRAGFARDRIASFFVNPPGQHDAFPIGGDHAVSQGAKESNKGVAAGAVAGAAVGVAAAPFLGPVGAVAGGLLGAHIGGLVGSLSKMKEQGETGAHMEDPDNATPLRKSGMMVAIAVDDQEQVNRAVTMLRSLGAVDIERAEGTIENGDWQDFDPLVPPVLVEQAQDSTRPSGPHQRT